MHSPLPSSAPRKPILDDLQPDLCYHLLRLLGSGDGRTPSQNPTAAEQKRTVISAASLDGAAEEIGSLLRLASPLAATAVVLFFRSVISMVFLGRLGEAELAGGSLAIAFANISGHSVLSGLALGMEPLCSQAFGAQRHVLLSLTLQRTVVFLLASSAPIALLWLHAAEILALLRQDPHISTTARTYLVVSLPDLLTSSFIHPLRIYLRAQRITRPLALATLVGTLLHLPTNLLLVSHLRLGVAGVAAAGAASNLFVLLSLIALVWASGAHAPTWAPVGWDCFTGWKPLVKLATPSCASVCLEWWWYEIMTLLCGLLPDPQPSVAAMGILIQTTSFLYIFPSSLGFAASTRVGNELGAARPSRAKAAAAVSIVLAAAMGLAAMAFAWGTRGLWGRFFTGDAEVQRLTAAALPLLGLCELGNAPQTVACGVLRGMARPSTAANVNLGAFYLVGMPVAVALGLWVGHGLCGLWLGLLTAQVCCAVLMVCAVGMTDWDSQSERAQMLTSATAEAGDGEERKQPLISVAVH